MMVRVVKDPEIRREELIDTAEELFVKKGYDETSVSEIVRKARVAQGTFYYYFKSKDEIRNAVIDKNISEVKVIVDKMMKTEGLNALERMSLFSMGFREWASQKGKLMEYIHQEKNEILHYRMSKKVLDYLTPAYEKIIRQGIKEGTFTTKYPAEAAKALMGLTESVFEGTHAPDFDDKDTIRKYRVILEFSELILGAKSGTFIKFLKSKGFKL
jgi:AcrR family transcriptional regulator